KRDSNSHIDNGAAIGRGDFITSTPGDAFDISAPISIRFVDALLNTQSYTWAPSDCVASGVRITCRNATRTAQGKFKQIGSPVQWKMQQVKLKNLAWTGPFEGPVIFTLSYGAGIDRVDTISDCKAAASGLNCREF